MRNILPMITSIMVLSFACHSLQAQLGLDLAYIEYTKEMGNLLKPCIGYGLIYEDNEAGNALSTSIGFTLATPKTWQDTVRYLTFENGSVAIPSYTVYDKISLFEGFIRMDYCFMESDISPLAGADVTLDIFTIDYHDQVQGVITSYIENETRTSVGVMPFIGMKYDISENFRLKAGFGKNYTLVAKYSKFSNWKSYINIIYIF